MACLAVRAAGDVFPGESEQDLLPRFRLLGLEMFFSRRRDSEELPTLRDHGPPGSVGKETVVPDPDETARKDVEQETPQERFGIEGHELLPVAVRAILPAKGHLPVSHGNEPIVRDADSMRVASEIRDDLLGSGERRLGS